jgi:hypothetical protein
MSRLKFRTKAHNPGTARQSWRLLFKTEPVESAGKISADNSCICFRFVPK